MSGGPAGPVRAALNWALALSLVPLLAIGCGRTYGHLAQERADLARRGGGNVAFAVIDDADMPSYLDGVRLAVERINATGGVAGGRALQAMVYPGGDRFDQVRSTANRIAADPRLVAVLGHRAAAVAVPASVIYQAAGLLFMPPFATADALTRHGFTTVLRMLPDNSAMAAQSAGLAALFGYRRIAILHARDDDDRERAFLFEDAARKAGIEIVFRGSFFADREDYRELLSQLDGVACDALYLSAGTVTGARLLAQLRGLGQRQPVIGSSQLNAGHLEQVAGAGLERILVPTVFNPDAPEGRTRRFVAAFRKTYGRAPDAAAAQGSDAVELLAALIDRAGSSDPRALSTAARYGQPWAGLTGIHAYDANGNLFGKHYGFAVLQFGRWWPLPGVTAPSLLSRFTAYQDAPAPDATVTPWERQRTWLALAKDILQFKRLGLVVPPGEAGRAAAGVARSLAEGGGFTVATCELSAAAVAPVAAPPGASGGTDSPPPGAAFTRPDLALTAARLGPLERAALACYSRLALEIDAMLTVVDGRLDPRWLRQLNRTLRSYQVPAFALADALDADDGLTLALVAPGVDLQDPLVAGRFGGLLHGVAIHDLNHRLADLPTVGLDLGALAALDRRLDPRVLSAVSRVLDADQPAPSAVPTAPATTIGSDR